MIDMKEFITVAGIGPLTHGQAITLIKIIAWVSKHEDCDVTEDEAKELCKSIQYMSTTRQKDGLKND